MSIMICSQCNKEFTKIHNLQKYCSKKCSKEIKYDYNKYQKKYHQSDKGKKVKKKYEQSVKGTEYKKKYSESDKRREANLRYSRSDKGKELYKKYYKDNSEIILEKQKKYRQSDKARAIRSKRLAEKRKTDPMYKIIDTIKSRLNKYLKASNIDKVNKTFDMVGCTPEFLKQYLEKKFKPGMTWKNHTKKGWHIDHIIPISKAETLEDINRLTHYTNLQPMWAIDNLKKGNKIIF